MASTSRPHAGIAGAALAIGALEESVTVEAAAVGTPTIGSDGAGISHWISHHGAGQVTRRSNAGELADAIIHALASPQIRESWARGCRDLVPEFSIDHIARKLVESLVLASPSLG